MYFSDNVTNSDLANLFIAQVPRKINDRLFKDWSYWQAEDIVAILYIEIDHLSEKKVNLRLTHNSRYRSGDKITIQPNCQFLNIKDPYSVLSYNPKSKCLETAVTVKNASDKTQLYYLKRDYRFGKFFAFE